MIYEFEYEIKTYKKINDIFNGLLNLNVDGYKSHLNDDSDLVTDAIKFIKELYRLDENDIVKILKVSMPSNSIVWKVVTDDI